MSIDEIYRRTGISVSPKNTLFQLFSDKATHFFDTVLMIPDLFSYWLTGKAVRERSIASTSGILSLETDDTDRDIELAFGLCCFNFPELIESGNIVGTLTPALQAKTGLQALPVIAVCGHALESAIVAVPCVKRDFLFIYADDFASVGTESLFPPRTELTADYNLSIEQGYGGSYVLYKNSVCMRLLKALCDNLPLQAEAFESFCNSIENPENSQNISLFDCSDKNLFPDIRKIDRAYAVDCIRAYYKRTGQTVLSDPEDMFRSVMQSIVFSFLRSKDEISAVTGRKYKSVYILGEGSKSFALCQLTADIFGVPVLAGPADAAAVGNAAVQLITLGVIPDLNAARDIIAASFPQKTYLPNADADYAALYAHYKEITTPQKPQKKKSKIARELAYAGENRR
jgi:sugar (pentulose or hexulose) kinase